MPEEIPPLPDLEIDEMSKRLTNQEAVNQALKIIYERRPDLFVKLGEREKTETDPDNQTLKEFENFIREEVRKEIDVPNLNVMTSVFWEARRRARIMYGLAI